MRKIILASTSPRRKEIMDKTRLSFEAVESGYEEDMTLPMPPAELAEFLSKGKAESAGRSYLDAIIIAADTLVAFEDKVLGKPKSKEEAKAMLQALSGKENDVITGVTILDTANGKIVTFHDTARVFIKDISEATIDAYIETGEPMDKAGAYAVQGIGGVLVERIDGDFFTVMGLPLSKLADRLKDFGITVL
jgi:septum formation protein